MTDGLFAFQECSNPAEEVIGWMSCGFSDDLTFGTAMCCPILDYPRECVWRGGETDGSKVCNPQCWEDEIALMSSASGGGFNVTTDLKTCEFGHKLFCCKSGHWRQLVELGHLSDCNEPCGAGYTTIASVKDPRWCNEPNTVLNDPKQARQVCSPNPVKFQKCQWRGTGNCELNNACEVGEYEYMRNLYDDAGKKCSTRNRDKALCCTVEGESAFDPVPIDDLIDTISLPATNLVSFELQELHDPENTEYLNPDENAFAWLWLSGPPSVFTSLRSKRDGSMSDLAFLDCNMTLGEPQHTIRFVCTADNGTKDPDCDRMMRYGLQGKLVELPSRCTVAKYAVADTVQIAADQTLPDWLSYIQNKTVLELVYHLDFGHIKRDSGNIGFRLDFDNVGHMWKGVVDASSVKKRSLLARFISYSLEAWQDKFALWRGYPGVGTEFRYDFNKTFVSRGYEVCATGPPAYTVIRGRGTVEATIKTGITMYGILGPKLNVQHASVFTEATISSELVLDVAVSGRYSTWGAQTADLWNGFTYDTFSHPGIIEISPFLRGQIRLDVNIQMRANFTAGLKSYTGEGGNVIQAWPSNIFGPVGQTYIASIDSGFTGSITSIKETDSLRVDIRPIAGVDIKFSPISSGTKKREIPFDQPTVYTYHNQFLALQVAQFHLQGAPAVLDVPNQWTASINGTPIVGDLLALQGTDALPLVGQVGSDFFIGIPPASLQVATGGAGDPDPGNGSSIQTIVVDDDSLFKEGIQQCALDDIEYCPYETVTCAISACELYPGSCEQNGGEEDGSPSNDTVSHVGPNPPRRDLLLKFKDGTTMNLRPLDNPPAGKIFNTVFGDDVLRAGFSFISRSDCSNPDIFDDPITSGTGYNVEHILELQTISMFLEALDAGKLSSRIPGSKFQNDWMRDSLPANTPLIRGQSMLSPNSRVFDALGVPENRKNFVLLAPELNAAKAKLWALKSPRKIGPFEEDVENWIACSKGSLSNRFLTDLRNALAVFDYLRDSKVKERFQSQQADIRDQLEIIAQRLGWAADLPKLWDEFMDAHTKAIVAHTKSWVDARIKFVETAIKNAKPASKPTNAGDVSKSLGELKDWAKTGISF